MFLCLITLAVYCQVVNHEFIYYDDNVYVTENPYIKSGLTSENVVWSFTAKVLGNWHPLTLLSHMLDCQLYGLNSGRHHLTSVFFHIANTLLLFLVLRRMTDALWRSAFVAALFAIHPLHVESVAWVAERKDVLSTFFWMLTMWGYVRYVERPGVNRYLLVVLFFVLGLMAKPMLVTLPFVLLLLDYWPLKRFQFGQSGGGRLVLEKLPLFVLSAASSVVTYFVQQSEGAVRSLSGFPVAVRIENAIISYINYIIKMFCPLNLSVFYPHPGTLLFWQISGACLLLVSISFIVFRIIRQHPYIAVGWLWYMGTLVPVIGLVQVGLQAMADRYTYISLIGIFIIIAWGFPKILVRWRYKKTVLASISSALLLILMTLAWFQVRYWVNSISLFEHALHVTTNNYMMHNGLGAALANQGKMDKAISHFSESLRINPWNEETQYILGLAFAKQGRIDEAIIHYYEALRINPRFAEAHNKLGVALNRKGEIEDAIVHFREALRISPDLTNANNNLKKALAFQRQQ